MLAFQEGFFCMVLVNLDIKLWDILDTAVVKE